MLRIMCKFVHFLLLHLFQRRRKRKKQEQVTQNENAEQVTITLLFIRMHLVLTFAVNSWMFTCDYILEWRRWGGRCRVWTGGECVRSRSGCWSGQTKSAKRGEKGDKNSCLTQVHWHSSYGFLRNQRASEGSSQIHWRGKGTILEFFACIFFLL